MRCKALAIPSSVIYSQTPFSNIEEESECCPKLREVFLTLSRANLAASNKSSLVSSLISLFSPPIMPAKAQGLLPSQITRFSLFNLKLFSSRVTISSPSAARLTTISPPSSLAQSKACIGCPISNSTKLVMSTKVFIERIPHRLRRFLIQRGEVSTLTSLT